MSRSSRNRLRLASEIERSGSVVDFACERCLSLGHTCIAMEDSSSRLKCSECVRAGKSCVNMSWSSLDKTREELSSKISSDEQQLAEVITRLLRNKKILQAVEAKAKRKAQCLMSEMEDSGDLVPEDCPAVNASLGASPAIWSSLGALSDFSWSETPQVPLGNS